MNLVNKDESTEDMEPEGSSDRDDIGQCHDLASNIRGEMHFPLKKSRGLGSQDIHVQEDSSEIILMDKNACIKCNRSGKLLVCSEKGCPIAVHEKCMGCWARFDGMGNFYCPYCSYKRALAESSRARQKAMLAKKALSIFIDNATSDGNQQKQKTGTTNRKEFSPSTVAGSGNENMRDSNAFENQSVQFQEDIQEVAFVPKCTPSNLPCNGADEPLGNNLNDVSVHRCSDNTRVNDCDDHRIMVVHRTESEPVVCGREEEATNRCESIEVSKRHQAEDRGQIDNNLHVRVLEDDRDTEHASASPVEVETLDGELHFSNKGKPNYGEGRREEEEQMKEQAQQTRLPSSCEEPAPQMHSKINTEVESGDLICRDTQPAPKHASHAKQANKKGVLSLNVGSPKRSSRKSSSELRRSTVQNEKIITSSTTMKLEKPSKKP